MKVTSPGIYHAINFVRNIPGVSKVRDNAELCLVILLEIIFVIFVMYCFQKFSHNGSALSSNVTSFRTLFICSWD